MDWDEVRASDSGRINTNCWWIKRLGDPFLEFVLEQYIESGVSELDEEKLPGLLNLKYRSLNDAKAVLGDVAAIRSTFIDFQKYLYQEKAAWDRDRGG